MKRKSLQPVLFAKEQERPIGAAKSLGEVPPHCWEPSMQGCLKGHLLPQFTKEKSVLTCVGLKMQAVDVLEARD